MSNPAAGWYADPTNDTQLRWWDGSSWTTETTPAPGAVPAVPSYVAQSQPAYGTPAASPRQVAPYAPNTSQLPPYAQGPQAYAHLQSGYSPYAGAAYADAPIGVWRSPIDNRPIVNNPIAAIKTVLSKYAQFDGRASRSEYWFLTLAIAIIYAIAMVVMFVPIVNLLMMLAIFAVGVGAIVPTLALSVRRLRDAGFHWAWLFLAFLPPASIALIVFFCMPSKHP